MFLIKKFRIAILLDYPNLIKSSLQYYDALIDFNCFLNQVIDCEVSHATVFMNGNGKNKAQDILRRMGFDIVIVNKGKDVDAPLMMRAATISNRIDTLILGSGDGDYCDLINYLHGKGIRTIVMCIEKSASNELLKLADDFIAVDDYLLTRNQE